MGAVFGVVVGVMRFTNDETITRGENVVSGFHSKRKKANSIQATLEVFLLEKCLLEKDLNDDDARLKERFFAATPARYFGRQQVWMSNVPTDHNLSDSHTRTKKGLFSQRTRQQKASNNRTSLNLTTKPEETVGTLKRQYNNPVVDACRASLATISVSTAL